MRAWLWHLFNDPLRDNPWSIVALILIVSSALYLMVAVPVMLRKVGRMFRRRSKETDVADHSEARNASERVEPVAGRDPEGNPPGSHSYIETPQQQRERRDEVAHRRPSSGEESEVPTVVQEVGYAYTGRPMSLAELPADLAGSEPVAGSLPISPEDSGVHAIAPVRPECPACRGRGYVPTTNDVLRESIALVADGGDMVVKEFYTRLLKAAPDLATLFPPDLLTAASGNELSDGYGQRNRLLGALVSLSQLYDPTNADAMARLGVFLTTWGGRHAAFQRPDGTVRGATLAEYEAVRTVLFGVLVDAAGDRWLPEYTAAWSEAYEHAARGMIAGQFAVISERAGQLHPRQPRT